MTEETNFELDSTNRLLSVAAAGIYKSKITGQTNERSQGDKVNRTYKYFEFF